MSVFLALALASARDLLGVHGAWGAFRDADRCYAIARPEISGGRARWRPFASVGTFPKRGQRNALHVRLSRARDRSGRVTLSVGERRFALAATGTDAWAPDAATERAIVGAMRSGRSMSVEAVAVGGRPFADTYRLDGAATAIDAAALACLGRR
ncbi:invasion associated locus B family protein [Sphingomonas lenta]|uniref:Uncharacterized protein n=1 Tax=Sphingomonas lenta TaxID=1141887 RepID=A0A2A2SED1_9SPHN|nr:invasion associated locus B family protein [Sphingomonas lenta]PAX07599.1 hypothetical protein CKY28_08065 [Sphingomonas lenta]